MNRSPVSRIVFLLPFICLTIATSQDSAGPLFNLRKWTSVDGRNTFFGKFVSLHQSGKVTIEKEGERMTFSAEKLSRDDQEFIGYKITFSTTEGETFSKVTISGINPDAVTVSASTGVASIPMEKLPESFRTRFGFDPEKAAQYRRMKAAQQKARLARLAEEKRRMAQAHAQAETEQQERLKAEEERQAKVARYNEIAKLSLYVEFEVLQVLPDGVLATDFIYVKFREGGVRDSEHRIDGTHFVRVKPRNIVDGQRLQFRLVQEAEPYSYKTVLGVPKTIRAWSLLSEFKERIFSPEPVAAAADKPQSKAGTDFTLPPQAIAIITENVKLYCFSVNRTKAESF